MASQLIRIGDIAELRYTPTCGGKVAAIEDGNALMLPPRNSDRVAKWMPLDLLELSPGQEEYLIA